ncbi:hypothetical protein HK096_011311 [Nowakowskiella sp. JEL0078]|nr:hypothetical protein HK096_011311 [Nowakowskiella sp. JEL0078]
MKIVVVVCCLYLIFQKVSGIFVNNQLPYISFTQTTGANSIALLNGVSSADIIVDGGDWPGVIRAAKDLQSDFAKISTRNTPFRVLTSWNGTISGIKNNAIVIGTLGKSILISSIISRNNIDVSKISGKWESFQVQVLKNVAIGTSNVTVSSILLILGSDKRGSIYGIYDLSEQIGISPWWWFADIVPTQKNVIYGNLLTPYVQGSPTVKYRGIFLNDEQPGLTNWIKEKFGPVYNSDFYVKVFELLLRLKANYLWPAMWDSMFGVDDLNNQRLADLYGIVMSTSHQEPMMRATKEWQTMGNGVWNYTTNSEFLKNFWDVSIKRSASYESYVVVGMRGDGDLPYSEDLAVSIQQKIVEDQRDIIAKYQNSTKVPFKQVWCLYKEVQGYFERGMRVPEDVTLLWVDDNWGNIRRLPTDEEVTENRSGGAGIYYHFDYVGDPRSYKWINTNHIPKIYEQLSLAVERGATQIFVVNVGDLKPMEIPIDFFMTYAWDSTKWTHNNLNVYLQSWSAREFGNIDHKEVAYLVDTYTKYNARRKPELLDVNIYSLIYFSEAETILAEWDDLEARALRTYGTVSNARQPSFFQLVLHPIQASATVNRIYINAARSQLYSTQVRNSANYYAEQTELLFQKDADITKQYHSLLNGKWNHIMDQTHLNYQFWQQPMKNSLPALNLVQTSEMGLPGPLGLAIQGSQGAWPGDNKFQCSQGYNCPPPTLQTFETFGVKSRWIDVFNRGPKSIPFKATPSHNWIKISPSQGTFKDNSQETRLTITIDWNSVPANTTSGTILISSTAALTTNVTVTVPVISRTKPPSFIGHLEGDGYVSIEAIHFTKNTPVDGVQWQILPNYGKTLGAVTPFPRTAKSFVNATTSPVLEYSFFLYSKPVGGSLAITSYIAPALNQHPTRPLQFQISVDNGPRVTFQPIPSAAPGTLPAMWKGMVADQIVQLVSTHEVIRSGAHTIQFWMLEPNIILEKIVLNITKTVPNTYLGPPESIRI